MVKFFPQAEARLIGIWDYTLEKWGEAQADEYVSELVAESGIAARRRSRWRPVTDRALRGVWCFRHRHYFVFFRELSEGGIGVITVLHGSMDIPARLKEDAERISNRDDNE